MKKALISLMCLLMVVGNLCGQESHESLLPGINGRTPAITFDYFPSRMHAFIWRNWTVVPVSRLATVLRTDVREVEEVAFSMGLPKQENVQEEWLSPNGYITVLRRNWHLLPYDQLTQLLGLTTEELAWKLKEDDFLYVKLGHVKPYCKPLMFQKPTEEMNRKALALSGWIKELGTDAFALETPRFDFVKDFKAVNPVKQKKNTSTGSPFELRMIYPYFATFGDPLLDKTLASYPEGMFQRLSEVGVNGIWMHSVLRMLVSPMGDFPGDERAAERIQGLQALVDRAAKYGIKVYLYMNEPRSMNKEFFQSRPGRKELGGVIRQDLQAFCTSNRRVTDWLTAAVSSVFTQVKGLGGVFSITSSENLTFCGSHGLERQCERCKHTPRAQLIVDVNKAIEKGVHQADPNAKVIVWDWGWKESDCEDIIRNLPQSCWFMSVSEWAHETNRGGVKGKIGEYSISEVGPSDRTRDHWRWAKETGLKTVAKVQVNTSWEFSPVPALPVLDLVAQHAENLSKESINGVMLSWSLGGFPSVNLRLFQEYQPGKKSQSLTRLAEHVYGKEAAPDVLKAWAVCSKAFKEFPYHVQTLYNGPQHVGPSNPLYIRPTGYASTMVGMPYDNYKTWCAIYPVTTWTEQMQKVADGFAQGTEFFQKAEYKVQGEQASKVHVDWIRCEVARIHLASSVQQALFYEARDRWLQGKDRKAISDMRKAAEKEAELVQELLPLVKADATIGYESSNHYFYLPIDLLEKYISVRYALRWLEEQ